MIRLIPAAKRHFSDFKWLQTYWLFSFASYYDPENIQFGALRVFNDDVVQPGMGFPTHPHNEMEIVTICLKGEMTHQDSLGNKQIIRAGDVQRMSAGTGITHSEFNLADTPVHFYQIWIYPDTKGLPPSYDQRAFDPAARKNTLLPVASGQGVPGTVSFHTAATIYLADLDPGVSLSLDTDMARRVFIYVTSGDIAVDGVRAGARDQLRIDPESARLEMSTRDGAEIILIDVPSCRGWGYDDSTLSGQKKS
jgi:redox-sensitive bicupin YhaK (pirin superfamily)